MTAHSNAPSAQPKPLRPYPHFPLFAHDNGQWAKKINRKLHYFGRWDDPDAALKKFAKDKVDLYAGPSAIASVGHHRQGDVQRVLDLQVELRRDRGTQRAHVSRLLPSL